jgi:hypothetical protein
MAIGLLFWILMLFWLIFGLWSHWPVSAPNQWRPLGNSFLLFILLLLLGWAAFGPPIR